MENKQPKPAIVIGLGASVASVIYHPGNNYSYVTFMSPSDITEHAYKPAESIDVAMSPEQRTAFISALCPPT